MMRIVVAGLYMVALGGCLDQLFDVVPSGVCEDEARSCFDPPDTTGRFERWCADEGFEYVEGATCPELGYAELCKEEEYMSVFGPDREKCADLTEADPTMPAEPQ
jgi:hypothetical protein